MFKVKTVFSRRGLCQESDASCLLLGPKHLKMFQMYVAGNWNPHRNLENKKAPLVQMINELPEHCKILP
jgi:hypothetical protein